MPSPSTIELDAEGSVAEPAADVLPAPAPAEKKKKPKPVGVTVGERAVAVSGKLEPMAEKHQTRVPWADKE
jgi:hypothetical protein